MAEGFDKLRQALDRETPAPRDDARERAVAAALDEFDTAAQGSGGRPRLTLVDGGDTPAETRGPYMPKISLRTRWAALAAVAVLAIAAVPVLQMWREEAPEVAYDMPVPVPQSSTAPQATTTSPAQQTELAPPAPANRPEPAASQPGTPSAPALSRGRDGAADTMALTRRTQAPGRSDVLFDSLPTTARYPTVETGGFKRVAEEPISTFSIDVDTTSYAVARAHLNRGRLPPATAVRSEELINYFPYAYARPSSRDVPFNVMTSVVPSPWGQGRNILHVAVQGYEIPPAERRRANLVFLIDVSGSMNASNRLPLVKSALSLLLNELRPDDTVSIVTYAGASGVALRPTPARERAEIQGVIDRLGAGGSTAGFDGLSTAYRLARETFVEGGVNRILLATDGDFNVGPTSTEALKGLVEGGRRSGVYLSVLGFGMYNYQDTTMQTLAQNGNGNAAYIDTLSEARKVLVEEANSTIFSIADDVKIQVEFNPATVSEYRLIGYETRMLRREDFNDDRVDAGEVGSGAVVTAIYEFVPAGGRGTVDPLRYAAPAPAPNASTNEFAFLRLRYKLPGEATSRLIELPIAVGSALASLDQAGTETRFAIAVAGFAELLRGGRHQTNFTFADVHRLAATTRGEDPFGYRGEFLSLVRLAESLARRTNAPGAPLVPPQ